MDGLLSGDRKPLSFAQPGKERQDSVFNGFQVAAPPVAAAQLAPEST